jgi:hypothetical protein
VPHGGNCLTQNDLQARDETFSLDTRSGRA